MKSIEEKIKRVLIESFAISEEEIKLETKLINDLDLDSLDFVELIMILEKEYDICILEDEAYKIKTVGQLIETINKYVNKEI